MVAQLKSRLRAAPSRGAAARQHGSSGDETDNRLSWLLGAIFWLLLNLLVVRYDWLDTGPSGTVKYDVAVGQAFAPNQMVRIFKLSLLVIGTILVLRKFVLAKRVLSELNPAFIAFFALVPLSAAWSISPSDTLARFVSILSVVQICWAFTLSGWHAHRFQNVLRPFVTLVIAGSIIVGLALPTWITEVGDGPLLGAWHGLVGSKNAFGQLAGFGVIFWIHTWLFENTRLWRVLVPLSLSVAALILSRSSTGLLAAVFAVALMALLHRLPAYNRRPAYIVVGFFTAVILIYGLAVLQIIPGLDLLFKPIALLTGKDTTFSARSQIWAIIREHIDLSPILGSGYGGYWIGPTPDSPSYTFLGRMYFYPFESHNGYLEMINDLGYVGLICLLSYLVYFLRDCILLMKDNRAQSILFLGLFFQQLLINLSESTWLNVTAPLDFIVTTLATFALARARLATHAQPQPQQQPQARRRRR